MQQATPVASMMTEKYAIDATDAFLQTWIGEEALQKQKIAGGAVRRVEDCRRAKR